MSSWIVSYLWVALLWPSGQCALECNLAQDRLASNYELSTAARNGIKFKPGQSTSRFQGLECTCLTDDEVLGDVVVSQFDANDQLINDNGQYDWKNSSVFKISNCEKLEVTMRRGLNDLATKLSGGVLIFENVGELNLAQFQIMTRGTGNDSLEGTFTSVYFKNVTIGRFPSTARPAMIIEDKIEVLFHHLKLKEGVVLDLAVTNRENAISPILRIEESEFTGPESLSGSLSDFDDTLKVTVKNEQFVVNTSTPTNEGCEFDYKGEIILKNNRIGLLRKDNLKVIGAMKLDFHDNRVQTFTQDAVIADSVKEFLFRGNTFKFQISQPLLELAYVKSARGCPKDDLPESAIRTIDFSRNEFSQLTASPFVIDADDYPESLFDKMELVNNTISSPCSCQDKPLSNDAEISDKIYQRLQDKSQCISEIKGEPLIGLRDQICQGNHPLTQEEKEQLIRDELSEKWTTYLIIAIVVSLILAVAATVLIMKLCCNNSGDVSPRGRD
ncbi:hypothetical protein TCAL_05869 [Tigriopus californicus]|uniref:Receptor L-domain domain-containing protein n=1 Tax=Tigriopus californicus TaxID=6832 RepID=A0A553NQG4_TIGCA|nr:uncharacterized protein LOC131879366 [Tigriopus californicus]TRY67657.1 hypothetical protein TCAL_05869 [Tigriopus californicus]